jgi:Cu(I)/Ag(I) efflux system membrane fusion protein
VNRNTVAGLALAVVGAIALSYWLGERAGSRQGAATAEPGAAATQANLPSGRRILYYRNPMGLPDTSPTPKKDATGMDYVPVYDGEESQGPLVRITPDRVQKLGVTSEEVARRSIARTVRAVGTVQADERQLRTISPKFEGWVKKLLVNTTGAAVRAGQPLMEVYSPDLITAQQEYAIASKGLENVAGAAPEIRSNMQALIAGSLQRLRNWDIGEEELRKLEAGEPVGQTLLLRSPITGIVLEKMAIEGMRFMPGETLYRLADLSSLWMVAEVFEQDLGLIRVGQPVRIEVSAYPDRTFVGKVAFIYPTVAAETRTARVRIELPNRDGLLKPDMFGTVALAAAAEQAPPLTVANTAVLDSGTRRVVLIERGAGEYEPREVTLGRRGDDYTEVLAGLAAGERVVTSANFLIDAESNLKSALGGFGGHAHGAAGGSGAPASPPESAPPPEKPSGKGPMDMPPSYPRAREHTQAH